MNKVLFGQKKLKIMFYLDALFWQSLIYFNYEDLDVV